MIISRNNQPDVLKNITCAYCGISFDEVPPTREHVIGRCFLPKGVLSQSWNVILRACSVCNGRKADLENDLSVLTMHPDALGQFAGEGSTFRDEVTRRISGKERYATRTALARSQEGISIPMRPPDFPSMSMTLGYVAPPQPDRERAFELARLHLTGFFYRITFDEVLRHGDCWPGDFVRLNIAPRSDWGSTAQRAFAKAVLEWPPRLVALPANGYFKVAIRRHPTATCWSWALEWNLNYRLIGFFGDHQVASTLVGSFPVTNAQKISLKDGGFVVIREEVPLPQGEDLLFTLPGDETSCL